MRHCLLLLLAGSAWAGSLAEPAFTRDDLDLAACKTFKDDAASPAEAADVLAALGLGGNFKSGHGWSAGEAGEKGNAFHYMIAFKKPVRLGSVWLDAGEFRYLKEDAPFPGDPKNPAHWLTPKVYPGQGSPRLVALPAGTTTRAVLATEKRSEGRSSVRYWRFSARRLHNITPDASAQAEAEFTQYSQGGPPHTYRAAYVTEGHGTWQNAGFNEDKKIFRPPVSDLDPSWFVLSWDEARTICGIYLRDNFQLVRVETFKGAEGLSPVAAVEKEWKRVVDSRERGPDGRWIGFEPMKTRGIRLLILKTDGTPQIARIDSMHVYTDLGAEPVPEFQPRESVPPPFQIGYSLEADGEFTLSVDNEKGRRARNLVARADRTKGQHAETWDLKDESGHYVEPGSYRWKAITHPPLQLRYEMTPYPNVEMHAPENSPWLNGASGPGGWMADHTPPYGVATVGDWVFFGAPCAESGVSFIACDLKGRKRWGIHSFAAWSGPRLMAADSATAGLPSRVPSGTGGQAARGTGGTVYVENPGWGDDEDIDRVWGVDIETHEVRQVVRASGTETRKRGARGMAARDGKLYLSIAGDANYLANAAGPATVDIENCQPRYKKRASGANEKEPDPRDDFLRGFRLKAAPPGNNGGLVWLESTKGPSRREHVLLSFHKPVPIGSLAFPMPDLKEKELRLRISVLKPDGPYPPNPDDRSQWIPIPLSLPKVSALREGIPGALPASKTAAYPPEGVKPSGGAGAKPSGGSIWTVIPAPPNTLTRALLISFVKGADDAVSDVLDEETKEDGLKLDTKREGEAPAEPSSAGNWFGQIEGMKLLRRRFQSLHGTAKVRVNSGTVAPDGSWDAERTEPVTAENPGIYALEWAAEQTMRGLAIKEMDGRRAEIEAYTGPATGPIDIKAKEGWTRLASYEQRRRYFYWPDLNHNSRARYMDGYVDFGKDVKTRAVRLRIVDQWVSREGDRAGLYGVRIDRGGLKLEPSRCRVDGVAPVQYLGGEPPIDSAVAHRIEVIDPATSKVVKEVPFENPGAIAFRPGGATVGLPDRAVEDTAGQASRGTLFTIRGNEVWKVDMEGGRHGQFVSDLVRPTCLAFDANGRLYVYDDGPDRKVIRVYDASGKLVQTIGTPGGYRMGPWDPYRFQNVTSIAIDREGHLWVVDWTYWPKRISQWSLDGRHLGDFFGNTPYGGGGVLDPWDKRRLLISNLEFELEWQKGTTRLKNLTWLGDSDPGELPIHIKDRIYHVTRPWNPDPDMPVGVVYLYEKDHLKRVAAVGLANYFPALRTPEVLSSLGKKVLEDYQFTWSDRNGDGKVQKDEVVFTPKRIHGVTLINRDLSCQAGRVRFQVKEFLPDGVPVYEEQDMPQLAAAAGQRDDPLYRLANGTFYRMGAPEACFTPQGEMLWSYRTEGTGVHALNSSGPWHPAQVVCQYGWIGHETAHAGDLGEFVVFKTNVGVWNIWTVDGLLAGRIFRDIRDPRRLSWSMREHERGLRVDDVTPSQEHFCGYFCRTFEDNRYYAVAGHNHASVVEVVGLDKFRRLGGDVKVTGEDLRKTQEWERLNAKRQASGNVRVLDCYRRLDEIKIDGDLRDWDSVPPTPLFTDDYAKTHGISYNAGLRVAYDDTHLYVCYEVRNMGPLANGGNQWDRLFKTGGSVDLQMSTDPAADPNRKEPVQGDLRLLMTYVGDKPMAVIYKAVVPGTPEEQIWKVISPVFKLSFDRVALLGEVKMARAGDASRYVLEAAVPLKAIGLTTAPNLRLKLDWGILVTDQSASAVLSRVYWANQATAILSDAPSEAALHPDLWGYVRFFDRSRKGLRMADPKDLLRGREDEGAKLELEEP